MTEAEAMAAVRAKWPRAKAVSRTEGGTTLWYIDDGDPCGGDLTWKGSDSKARAWKLAAEIVARHQREVTR